MDWGLGHATRCIPVIKELLKQGAEVVIGADNRPLELLKNEFPELEFIKFPSYQITYPDKGSMVLKMLFSIPKIWNGIKKEHHLLQAIIKKYSIDAVISDNRFGLWTGLVPCVFITHQINIKSPFGENFLYRINKYFIKKYDKCWIPDYAGENNLSGDLSHLFPLPINADFIGVLSRFQQPNNLTIQQFNNLDLFVIISGPEPQRTIFEKLIFEQLKTTKLKTVAVCGTPEKPYQYSLTDTIKVFSHLQSDEFLKCILDAEIIISRSGYSTIMDLAALNKKAIFIPTPGQTEQEYLAKYLSKKQLCLSYSQNKFNIKEALQNINKISPLENNINLNNNIIKQKIQNLLFSIQ